MYDWLYGWIDGDVMFPWKLAGPEKNLCKLRQKGRTGVAGRSSGDDVVDTLDQVQLDASWQTNNDGCIVISNVEVDVVELPFVADLQCSDASRSCW